MTAYPILGPDISVWQDDNSTSQKMNWNKFLGQGGDFVLIKASQGTFLDQDYIDNSASAKSFGIRRGFYHFLDWRYGINDQVTFFTGILKNDPGEVYATVDYEMNEGCPASAEVASSMVYNFTDAFRQKTGRQIMLYTSNGYWRAHGSTLAKWKDVPLWIANYGVSDPMIPEPWKSAGILPFFWQFTSTANGYAWGAESQYIDMNYWMRSEKEFYALFAGLPQATEFTTLVEHLNVRNNAGLDKLIVAGLGGNSHGRVLETAYTSPDLTPQTRWHHILVDGWVKEFDPVTGDPLVKVG